MTPAIKPLAAPATPGSPRDLAYRDPASLFTLAHLSDAVPALSDADHARLRDSIISDGVREPIVVDNDSYIIDGHHRHSIALEAAITKVPVVNVGSMPAESARRLAIESNLHRRQLTPFQIVNLAKHVVAEEVARSRRAKKAGKAVGRTNERIAKRLNVSKDTVKRARKVMADPDAEAAGTLAAGTGSLKAAAEKLDARDKRKRQRAGARQAALESAATRYSLLLLDLRHETFPDLLPAVGCDANSPARQRERELNCLPGFTLADIVGRYCAPDAVLVISLTDDQVAAGAGLALAAACTGCFVGAATDDDTANLTATTLAHAVALQQIALAGGVTPDRRYTSPHGYLLHLSLGTLSRPAVPLHANALAGDAQESLAAAWPGTGLKIIAAGDSPPGRLPASWSYASLDDVAAALRRGVPVAAAAAAADGAGAPAPAEPAAAPAPADDDADTEAAIADYQRNGLIRRAWTEYLNMTRKAAGRAVGETHLWITAKGRPSQTHPADFGFKVTTSSQRPRGVGAWRELAVVRAKSTPGIFARMCATQPQLINSLLATPPPHIATASDRTGCLTGSVRLDKRVGKDMAAIETTLHSLLDNSIPWTTVSPGRRRL